MKRIRKMLVWLLGNERSQGIVIPIVSILLSLIVGGIVIAALGKNPFDAYANLLRGSGLLPKARYAAQKGILSDLGNFLNAWPPMLFASLAVALALKAGLFNIGVAGQMLCGGFAATAAIGYTKLPAVAALPLAILIGFLAGALLGAFVGFLKYRFNINEVVSTIMLNYIMQYIVAFCVNSYYIDPISRQSRMIADTSRLTLMGRMIGGFRVDISLAIVLAILAAVLLKYILDRSTFGFELKAVGSSRSAALYAGVNVRRRIVDAMTLSGGLAGLAGVAYFMGYYGSIQPGVLPATGFDSIAVALLGNSNPIGIIASSLLISVFDVGSTYMSSASKIQAEIANVIIGLLLLFAACTDYIRHKIEQEKERLRQEEHAEVSDANNGASGENSGGGPASSPVQSDSGSVPAKPSILKKGGESIG